MTRSVRSPLPGAALAGIASASLSLRPLFSSLAALLPEIRRDLGISSLDASILSMLPVACLGIFSFAVPSLIRRCGAERTLSMSLLIIAAGSALRGIPTFGSLAIGTALAGAGIACGNVVLPAIVKKDYVERIGSVTALYTSLLCAGAGLAALTTPIIERRTGSWSLGLLVWAVPALAAFAVWTSASRGRRSTSERREGPSLLREPMAWQLTAFMGLQSALAYSIFGWLAWILEMRGLSSIDAGRLVACSVLTQVVSCACIPPIAVRCRSQSALAILLSILATAGLIGMIGATRDALLPIALLQGVGQGGLIALAMTMIILRSANVEVSGRLSGLVQGVGYLLASAGSLATGLLASGASAPLLCLWVALLGTATAAAGALAGRNMQIGHAVA